MHSRIQIHMGGCQNYGPLLGPLYYVPYYIKDPKRDHSFDNYNHPCPSLSLARPMREPVTARPQGSASPVEPGLAAALHEAAPAAVHQNGQRKQASSASSSGTSRMHVLHSERGHVGDPCCSALGLQVHD